MDSVLANIDAALDQKCACGCGRPLDPNGASMWFAGPDCQQRYLERQATDPHDVYNRPDATHHLAADIRRAYLEAPPSAHAPGVIREENMLTEEQTEAAPTPQLAPVPNGPDQFREWLNGLLRRSEWGTLRSPLARDIADVSPDAYWPSEAVTPQQWMEANPTAGGRVEPGAAADFAEGLGLQLEPWQHQMLDAVYSEPQPRLFGNRSDSIQVGEWEIPVQILVGAPEGSVMVVNDGWLRDHLRQARVSGPVSLTSEYDFQRDVYRIRYQARVVAEVTAEMLEPAGAMLRDVAPSVQCGGHVAVYDESARFCAKHFRPRRWIQRPRQPKIDPKLHKLHSHYRQRVLARRRRRR